MKQIEKMGGINPAISIITLKGDELGNPFKGRDDQTGLKKSQAKPSAVNKTTDSKT